MKISDEAFQHQLQHFGPLVRGAPRPAVVRWLRERPARLPLLHGWLQRHVKQGSLGYGGYGVGFVGDFLYEHKGAYVVSLFSELAAAEPDAAMDRAIELMGALPKNGKRAAEGLWAVLELQRPDDAGWSTLWDRVLAKQVPFRAVAVRALRRQGHLSLDRAARGLSDAGLRKTCLDRLLEDPASAYDRVLPLAEHASRPTREAALRVLRVQEPTFGMDAVTATEGDADALVLADALTEQGDPRGQLITLTRTIEQAPPARALQLSQTLADYVQDHREPLWGQPGGWPTRERYRGRQYLELADGWTFRSRKDRGIALVERIEAFLARFGTRVVPIDTGYPTWSFVWAHRDTGIALPFHEVGHYAGSAKYQRTDGLDSSLTVHPETGFTYVRFAMPFEQRTPAFVSYVEQLEEELGRKLLRSREWCRRRWDGLAPWLPSGAALSAYEVSSHAGKSSVTPTPSKSVGQQ